MSSHSFLLEPQDVGKIKTKNRIIQTKIPCPGTIDIIKRLNNVESRSMHGQLPLVWQRA